MDSNAPTMGEIAMVNAQDAKDKIAALEKRIQKLERLHVCHMCGGSGRLQANECHVCGGFGLRP